MKDKIFDFLLIFSLSFLIASFFFGPEKEDQSIVNGGIEIKSLDDSYTNPNAPIIEIKNNTSDDFVFNTCEDLEIRKAGKELDVFEGECNNVSISSSETYSLDFASKYEIFQEEASYSVLLKNGEEEYSAGFVIEHKGTINKLFTAAIYQPIFNLVAWLIEITGHSLGWGIVLITLIIRLILLVPQHKMMVSQRKMQKIQPKIKELQEKHKGNNQVLGMELMALYKRENVSPAGACLPLLIQMPILIVVYHILTSIIEPENLVYLYSFLKDFNIEGIISNFFGLELLTTAKELGIIGIILALSVGIIQFIQIKLSFAYNGSSTSKNGVVLEKKAGEKDYSKPDVPGMPSQEDMNKFMLYVMPVMITGFTFFFPAGLGIYWGLGTIFMIAQQFVVNKLIPAK